MEKSYNITKLENIIRRIFNSIDSIELENIEVHYLGKKSFIEEKIDQRCFQFEKHNADFLFFELLIPSNDNESHKIALEQFMHQIMFKYNVENIACFLHDGVQTDEDHLNNFMKEYVFEVICFHLGTPHKVYVNIDPDEFFS
jgi:hypothetical protein